MRGKNKNIIIIGLIGIVMIMAVSYAAFNSALDIKGTGSITSNWKIIISNIALESKTDGAEEVSKSFDNLSANFSFNLNAPGDSIKYAVTVSNEGTLNAVLDSIKINMNGTDIINYTVEGIESGSSLNVNEDKTFYVTFKFNEDVTSMPSDTSFNLTMELNYLQEGNDTNFSTADTDTSGELAINSISLEPEEQRIKVTVDASNAIKYYYSIDNNSWYESNSNVYTLTDLDVYKDYTVYVKAEDSGGNVVFSSASTKTTDETNPNLTITEKEIIEGDNGWNNGVTLSTSVRDNGSVKEVLYCSTTEETCEPTQKADLNNGSFDYIFEENSLEQKLCVKATDEAGNEITECSNGYLVDGIEPVVDDLTLTPADDTLLVEVEASDKGSGPYTYYYSKDNGSSYVESQNPNYTFTDLPEADYLVVVYVKDKAGNVSVTKAGTATIRHASFCEHNDITDLGDCIIQTEAGNETDIETAKQTIQSKGTPNFNVTSPSINYEERISTATSIYNTTMADLYIGTNYTFNKTTGMYDITNGKTTDPSTLDFSDGKVYYTNTRNFKMATPTLFKIIGVSLKTNSTTGTTTYLLTKYDLSQTTISYDTSSVGLYSGEDNDGITYYYRGSVGGNYVLFDDKYWRIIRVNGDGTVRMIYDGTSAHVNGEATSNRQVGISAFNSYLNDNTYVGYMYGDVNNFEQTDSGDITFNYTGLSSSTRYYFGTSYTFNSSSRSYTLSGDLHSGTVSSDQVGYYTCFNTSSTASCQRLFYTTRYNSSTSMTVSSRGFGTTSVTNSVENINNSTMKTYLDNWYQNNLSDVDNMISKGATFCNNRNKSTKQSGTYNNLGYGINPTIYGSERIYNWASQGKLAPTLTCETNDTFSVNRGNKELTYPVGLITADEVNMAGGISGAVNSLYYLCSGTSYWTMTPQTFTNSFVASEFAIFSTGFIGNDNVTSSYGVRPVINLDPSNITFTGSGTMQDPYVIENA